LPLIEFLFVFGLVAYSMTKCGAGACKDHRIQRLHWKTIVFSMVWFTKWAEGYIRWRSKMCWMPKMCFVSWKDFCYRISLWKSKGCFSMGWFWTQNWWGNSSLPCQLHFVSARACIMYKLFCTWLHILWLKFWSRSALWYLWELQSNTASIAVT